MLLDLLIDEEGFLDEKIITDVIGNTKQTIKNRMKTLIIKTLVYDGLVRKMCGDRILDVSAQEIKLEIAIKKKLNELYFNDEKYLQNLKVNVFIVNNVIWIYFYYEYSSNEKIYIFDKKIKI